MPKGVLCDLLTMPEPRQSGHDLTAFSDWAPVPLQCEQVSRCEYTMLFSVSFAMSCRLTLSMSLRSACRTLQRRQKRALCIRIWTPARIAKALEPSQRTQSNRAQTAVVQALSGDRKEPLSASFRPRQPAGNAKAEESGLRKNAGSATEQALRSERENSQLQCQKAPQMVCG